MISKVPDRYKNLYIYCENDEEKRLIIELLIDETGLTYCNYNKSELHIVPAKEMPYIFFSRDYGSENFIINSKNFKKDIPENVISAKLYLSLIYQDV